MRERVKVNNIEHFEAMYGFEGFAFKKAGLRRAIKKSIHRQCRQAAKLDIRENI